MRNVRCFSLAAAAAFSMLGPLPASADGPFSFHTLTPCRLVDTRTPPGPSGGPALPANTTRNFPIQGVCGVPTGAKAAALNVTAVAPSGAGYLNLFPSGIAMPLTSTVNFGGNDFATANGAIVPLSTNANDLSVFAAMYEGSGNVHLVLDVTGYFQ